MTTNTSLMDKFSDVQQESEPLRVRTFEVKQDDRVFVSLENEDGTSLARLFGDKLFENYGWAFPELAGAVCDLGGAEKLAVSGRKDFLKTFGFKFLPQERFYEAMIISAWTMGRSCGAWPVPVRHQGHHTNNDRVCGRSARDTRKPRSTLSTWWVSSCSNTTTRSSQ